MMKKIFSLGMLLLLALSVSTVAKMEDKNIPWKVSYMNGSIEVTIDNQTNVFSITGINDTVGAEGATKILFEVNDTVSITQYNISEMKEWQEHFFQKHWTDMQSPFFMQTLNPAYNETMRCQASNNELNKSLSDCSADRRVMFIQWNETQNRYSRDVGSVETERNMWMAIAIGAIVVLAGFILIKVGIAGDWKRKGKEKL